VRAQERARDAGEVRGQVHRRGHAHRSARLAPARRRGVLRVLQRGERVAGTVEERPAGVGERELAGGTLQEADAELRLERRDAAARRRLAHAEGGRRRGEGAGVDDADEHRHAVQVHRFLQRNISLRIRHLVRSTATL
jgi:hypothetical protein